MENWILKTRLAGEANHKGAQIVIVARPP